MQPPTISRRSNNNYNTNNSSSSTTSSSSSSGSGSSESGSDSDRVSITVPVREGVDLNALQQRLLETQASPQFHAPLENHFHPRAAFSSSTISVRACASLPVLACLC